MSAGAKSQESGKPCSSSLMCDFNLGTIVTINNLVDTENINFQLISKSIVTGKVVDEFGFLTLEISSMERINYIVDPRYSLS